MGKTIVQVENGVCLNLHSRKTDLTFTFRRIRFCAKIITGYALFSRGWRWQ